MNKAPKGTRTSRHGDQCQVSSALGLVLRASQVVGAAPVRLETTPIGHQVFMSRRLHVFQIALMSVLNVACISGFLLDTSAGPDSIRFRNPIMRAEWTVDLGSTALTASVAAYGGYTRIQEVINCLSQLEKIKHSLGVTRADNRSEWRKVAVFIAYLCTVCVLLMLDYYILMEEALRNNRNFTVACLYSTYEYSYIMVVLLEMQFVYSAMEVAAVLQSFNNVLENILVTNKGQSIDVRLSQTSKPTRKHMKELTGTFDGICAVMQKLAAANNVALAILLGTFASRLVITPFNYIKTLRSGLPRSPVWKLVLPFWCAIHFFNIIMLVEPSHLTQIQIYRTGTLISELKNCFTDVHVSSELVKFSTYVALHRGGYSPLGICTLSRSVVLSIVGTITTYLVILVQLQFK